MTPVLLLAFADVAFAAKPVILGSCLDRNGAPVERVNVKLSPGDVDIITDETGTFRIDYLRDEAGERTKLAKRTDYSIEYFKVGFHPETATFYFKRGELILEPVTLKQDTIKVDHSTDNIDASLYPDRAQTSGGSYEGE